MKYEQDFIITVVDNGFIIKSGVYKPDYVESQTIISKDKEEIKAMVAAWLQGITLGV